MAELSGERAFGISSEPAVQRHRIELAAQPSPSIPEPLIWSISFLAVCIGLALVVRALKPKAHSVKHSAK